MISNTDPNSNNAFSEISQTSKFEKELGLMTEIVQTLEGQQFGAPTTDEVRQHLLNNYAAFNGHKGKDEVGARMADTWRILGSIRQTGVSRESNFSKKTGMTWQFVAEADRPAAIVAYWTKRQATALAQYEKGAAKIAAELVKLAKQGLGASA